MHPSSNPAEDAIAALLMVDRQKVWAKISRIQSSQLNQNNSGGGIQRHIHHTLLDINDWSKNI